ncbi:MAG: hypothetical protein ACP5OV_00745 [Acidimicrobiales bacterium]
MTDRRYRLVGRVRDWSVGTRGWATLDGYAVEGGFDTDDLTTCWSPAVALGQVLGPGPAADLWAPGGYEAALAAAAGLGLDGVRITLEWARLEPRAGQPDEAALARYLAVVAAARAAGLAVVVALLDGTWPLWAGAEAWLLPWVRPHFVAHAARVADALPAGVGVVAAVRPTWLVRAGYLTGEAPPWRRRARADAASAAASLTATLAEARGLPALRAHPVDDGRVRTDRSLVTGAGPLGRPGLLTRDGAHFTATAAPGAGRPARTP